MQGTCWETTAGFPRCGGAAVAEDFSTGRYNVHAFASVLHADGVNDLTLTRTGGDWDPALIVVQGDAMVLFDGAIGRQGGGLTAAPVETGRDGSSARVQIETDERRLVHVHVTSWAVLESGFVEFLPADATYDLAIDSECEGGGEAACVVNGAEVEAPACGWLNAIGREVVPMLGGDRETNLTSAARVAWWSLKEGVLFLPNPVVYSNCHYPDGDEHVGPLVVCPRGGAWQVGLAAVQVPTFQLAALEATAATLFPSLTLEQVLERTAGEALLDPEATAGVVASMGDLRRSWLLRNSAIGFTHQVGIVTRECVSESRRWCYGTGWTATRLFAPNRSSALAAIESIRRIFDAVAPQ